MPRGSPELTTARREENIAACAALYENMSFKEIGAATSFTRTSIEMDDPACRPAIAGELPDLTAYDTVLIGSPIWWGDAPRILSSFVERVDLTDKTLAVFFTSGSSGLGNSMKHLEQQAGAGTWLEGRRFTPRTTAEELKDWAAGLGIEP